MTTLRAGAIGCACDGPDVADMASGPASGWQVAALAGGFGLAVLSQTLAATILPLAALQMGIAEGRAILPFVAMLTGAGLATFPASLLADGRGHRGGFAIGAALGIGGGLLGLLAVDLGRFELLLLSAFWLGVAQGFGLFHRHLAASSGRSVPATTAIVIGAGVVGGLAGPSLMAAADAAFAPILFRGPFVAIALLQLLAAALALTQRQRLVFTAAGEPGRTTHRSEFAVALALGTIAWFAMNAAMAGAPLAMVGCGLGATAVAGAIAWHGVAMYAAAPVAGLAMARLGAPVTAGFALALIAGGAALLIGAGSTMSFSLALALIGFGWGAATLASTVMIARAGPTRARLALHDAGLFAAAILGALAAAGI